MKCFMCDVDVDGELVRTTLPKEILGKDSDGNLSEDFHPICQKCFYFKRIVDLNFVRLCEEAKLFEWYRANSKRKGEYFPSTLIYNVDIAKLRELYYYILDVCEAADRVASDDQHRTDLRDELNYMWRKKDE